MKIYSKFKDYYDCAGHMGEHDPAIPYKRKTVDLEDKEARSFLEGFPTLNDFCTKKSEYVTYIYVVFCGTLYYRSTAIPKRHPGIRPPKSGIVWNVLTEKFMKSIIKEKYHFTWSKENPRDFYAESKKDFTHLNTKYKSPIIMIDRGPRTTVVTVDPKLNELNFASAIGPWEAYQKLEQFVDTHFVNPPITDNIPQEFRFPMKGHDNVTSFRKEGDTRPRKMKKSLRKYG